MKKFILLFLFLLISSFYCNAQVIDIVGKGVDGDVNSSLPLTEIYTIDSVVVEAVYRGNEPAAKNGVSFYDSDEKKESSYAPISKRTDIGKFYRTFYTSDKNGVFSDIEIKNVYSFYEFIYRTKLTSTFKSFPSLKTAYMYHNGSKNPFSYKIAINTDLGVRNITVKIPITELNNDERVAVIDISIGEIKKRFTVNTYNTGSSFFLGEYKFTNVPGNVDHIMVNVFSPTKAEALELGFSDGDSFIISGVIANVDKVGCTLTQGYWKNHSDCKDKGPKRDNAWDKLPNGENTSFFLSNQNYCEVFDTNPGKGGKYYILAHQYMAAQLNLLNNSNPYVVSNTFMAATNFLNKYTPGQVDGSKELEAKCVQMGGTLDDYNNGRIGPGHCDDKAILSVDDEKILNNFNLYPNPSSSNSYIEFVSNENSKTSIELFDIIGKKVGVLYNKETQIGEQINVNFNSQMFKSGIYIMQIKNGSIIANKKIIISN